MSNFYCAIPAHIARYPVISVFVCSSQCSAIPDCAHFNFGRRNDVMAGDDKLYYCDVSGQGTALNPPSSVADSWDFYTLI
jgi:hypothetical protein